MIPVAQVTDSFLAHTARYNHLEQMGAATVFPGASDNASGTALLLSLAQSLAQFPQRYSLLFIAFAGEEARLLGSKYFTENPLVDLKKIRFLLNLDILGDAAEGITVVNGEEFKQEFACLQSINRQLPESIIRLQASTLLSMKEEGKAQSREPASHHSTTALSAGELNVPPDEEQLLAHYPEDTTSTDFPNRPRAYPPSVTSSWKSLPFIIARGPAANSDHYYFYLKGVPCFFIYSNGGPGYYHDIWDKPGTLSLTNIDQVQALIERFIISFQNTSSNQAEALIFGQ